MPAETASPPETAQSSEELHVPAKGAAYATIIGQAVTLAVYLVLWKKGRLHLHISLREGWESRRFTGRLYNVGIPATLNQALPSILISMLNGILAGYSQTGILILGIYYEKVF